ncbi:hypothetical protein QQ045_008626 [Rhodiola kirilowii]
MGDCSNSLDWVPDQEKNTLLVKVVNLDKQLWKCVQSTGLMSSQSQLLYKQACSCFEKLVQCEMEFSEIQDVEYSLWKLHYKHIDEFRKRIRQKGTNVGSPRPPKPPNGATGRQNSTNLTEGFKLFLSEATKFYQDILLKVRKHYGFLEDKFDMVIQSEATIRKCQFMCHRFLICIGDLARYKELHDNNDTRNRNWSVSATYYMKATVIWPDGGNSQNQLALLATYVGDEFLALVHCIRSLAVTEPFPDALNNLMLLFEKNQSAVLHSVSKEVRFDFSNPSARINFQRKIDTNCSEKTELWPLFIRLMSFFLTKNRSEDFPCILAATMHELEALMELDNVKLRASLESYQHMGASRTGPFKALHIVSVLIFVFKHLTKALNQTEQDSENATQQLELMQLSLVTTFLCIGRLVDRCVKSSPVDSCPLLPGVLVFLEWLAVEKDEVNAYCGDGKVLEASCYFFDSVVKLLNLIRITRANGKNKFSNVTALWEDFELQGFVPISEAHVSLDFSDHIENRKNFENGQQCRARRICNAAVRLSSSAECSRQWICYDQSSKTFSTPVSNICQNGTNVPEPDDSNCSALELAETDKEELDVEENSDVSDEEEVILFKPIVRHNSAPIQKCTDTDSSMSVTDDPQQLAVDECIRRSKSLLISENQLSSGSGNRNIMDRDSHLKTAPPHLNPMFSDFVPLRQPETSKELSPSSPPRPFPETNSPVARGPPSLNAWVLDQGSSSTDRVKDLDSICKSYLKPIEVAAPCKSSIISSSHFSPVSPKYSYSAMPPSMPCLRPGAPWEHDNSSDLSPKYINSPRLTDEDEFEYPSTAKATGLLSPNAPVSPVKHRPLSGMLTSSEWLRQYREKQGLKQPQTTPTKLPDRSYTPPRTYTSPDASAIELYDRWGNPVVSVPTMNLPVPPPFSGLNCLPHRDINEHIMDKLAPKPYRLGSAVDDVADEARPLLQYLKERELWRMQQKQRSRSPPAY